MTERFYRREELVGKEVYDAKAMHVGTVRDVGYSVNGRTALVVSKAQREETIPFQDISEIHDIILLKKPFMDAKTSEARPMETEMTAPSASADVHAKETLSQMYRTKYPHNAEGVLEFHMGRLMREGMTEEQAVSELTRRNALGETLVEPKATEPMPREEKPESKITATAIPSVPASKTCPKCQRENKPTAQFCVQCGHRFV